MLRIALISFLVVGASICSWMGVLSWRRRPAVSAILFSGLMLAVAAYAFGYTLELLSLNLEEMMWSIRIEYLGVVNVPALWLSLALFYTNHTQWMKPSRLVILWILPVVSLLVVFTNDLHHLFYTSASLDYAGPFFTLQVQRGPLYWLHPAYSFVSFFFVVFLLARRFPFTHTIYRKQVIVMLVASLLTITVASLHLAGIEPIPNLDANPFAMILSGLIMGWGFFNFRLIELTPLAHDVMFENMVDGVIVLDDKQNLLDFNPAAARIFNLPRDAVGEPLKRFLMAEAAPILDGVTNHPGNLEIQISQVEPRCYEVNFETMNLPRKQPGGSLLVLHDITERKSAELQLQKSEALYRSMAENLAQSQQALEQRARELAEEHQKALELMSDAHAARWEAEAASATLQAQLEENKNLQEKLREQAIRDPLTSCFNRRYLDETLEREFARAQREAYSLSLVMIDIDQFKNVNDTYGHLAGDAVLRALGKMLRNCIRAGDIVARYGGEEFLMVYPYMKPQDAIKRSEFCRSMFQALEVDYEGSKIFNTISLGVASYPLDGNTSEQVIKAADRGLYAAKNAGRNCVRTSRPG